MDKLPQHTKEKINKKYIPDGENIWRVDLGWEQRNAALRGAEIALENQSIKTSEQLPERGINVLIWYVGTGHWFIGESEKLYRYGAEMYPFWQPLPTPPKP